MSRRRCRPRSPSRKASTWTWPVSSSVLQEGRVVADVDGGAVPAVADEDARRVHAAAREDRAGLDLDVGRGNAQRAAALVRRARRGRSPTAAGRGSRGPPRARRSCSSWRMRVELIGRAVLGDRGGTTTVSKPCALAAGAQRVGVAGAAGAEVEVLARRPRPRARRASARTCVAELRRGERREPVVERQQDELVGAQLGDQAHLLGERREQRAARAPGSTTASGWRSKVTTVATSGRAHAPSSTARPITARCPTCTPSKVPMARRRAAAARASARSRDDAASELDEQLEGVALLGGPVDRRAARRGTSRRTGSGGPPGRRAPLRTAVTWAADSSSAGMNCSAAAGGDAGRGCARRPARARPPPPRTPSSDWASSRRSSPVAVRASCSRCAPAPTASPMSIASCRT